MMASRRFTCRCTIPRKRMELAGSSKPSSRIVSTKPLINVIGVRSSWETLATKSRRTFSRCRSRVTSCSTIRTPIFSPRTSCSAVPWACSPRD